MIRELDNLNKQIRQLTQQGRYRQAESLLLQAVELTGREHGESSAACGSVLNELGGLYRATGEYPKSEEYYLKAIDILAGSVGPDSVDYATVINNLAGTYRLAGDFARSEELFHRAIGIPIISPLPSIWDSPMREWWNSKRRYHAYRAPSNSAGWHWEKIIPNI